jgi:hypothetical protein
MRLKRNLGLSRECARTRARPRPIYLVQAQVLSEYSVLVRELGLLYDWGSGYELGDGVA